MDTKKLTPGHKLLRIGVMLSWSLAICLTVWAIMHTGPAPKWWIMGMYVWGIAAIYGVVRGVWEIRRGR